MRRWALVVAALCVGIVVGVAPWQLGSGAIRWHTQRPNVVVVIGCTVRADQTSLADPSLDTTPFLASLAARGVRFADAIAAAPWTKASSGALLTGVHPARLGLMEQGPGRNDRALPDSATTLSEVLHGAGWATVGVTANPNLDPAFGFDQGFDAYASLTPLWTHRKVAKVHGSEVVRRTLDLVCAQVDEQHPMYVQALFVDAHKPYDAPVRRAVPGLPHRVDAYRASLRAFDAQVRALHAGLARLGITDENTVFVVVSDHGEGLSWPVYNGPGHGRYPYPAIVQQVWAMAGGGLPAGRVVSGLASGVDLAPTLLGWLGVPAPTGLDGRDLSSAIRRGGATGRDVAYTDTRFLDVDRAGIYTAGTYCVHDFAPDAARQGEDRRRWPHFRPGCFDRRYPPFSTPVQAPDLAARLLAWRHAVATPSTRPDVTISPDLARHLRALGYTDGRGGSGP